MVLKYRQNASSPWETIEVIQGPVGPQGEVGPQGPKGDKGDTYTITTADYDAIASVVLTKLPSTEEVSY